MASDIQNKKHMKMIGFQAAFLIVVLAAVYFLYPRTDVNVDGTIVKFRSINAQVVILSENPDFTNPRYLDFEDRKNISFSLRPGTYYWKASNGYLEGLAKEFTINSQVGMKMEVTDNSSRLENVGNVKLNVSRDSNGLMVGHIILETDEEKEVEDSGQYIGRQM
jgi:hypothetical protein